MTWRVGAVCFLAMNRIASFRRAAKLSQRQLAEQMNVRVETVSRWERGKTTLPDQQKLALASLFNVSVGFLMGWDEPNGENRQPEVVVA